MKWRKDVRMVALPPPALTIATPRTHGFVYETQNVEEDCLVEPEWNWEFILRSVLGAMNPDGCLVFGLLRIACTIPFVLNLFMSDAFNAVNFFNRSPLKSHEILRNSSGGRRVRSQLELFPCWAPKCSGCLDRAETGTHNYCEDGARRWTPSPSLDLNLVFMNKVSRPGNQFPWLTGKYKLPIISSARP